MSEELIKQSAPSIGDTMEDGTIYAGISSGTGKPMYAAPADAPQSQSFFRALDLKKAFNAHGHKDWRIPTKGELAVLFAHRAAIGGFNETGRAPASWYWSSQQDYGDAWAQRFNDGYQSLVSEREQLSLRLVRG